MGKGWGWMVCIVKRTNYHLGRRLHSLADRIIVSTRAQMSRLTVKSESTAFHVANAGPGITTWGGSHSLADRINVSTRAQMSRLTVKSEPTVFHVANAGPGITTWGGGSTASRIASLCLPVPRCPGSQ